MKTVLAIFLASVYGLTIRLSYGFLDDYMGIMSVAFLIITPAIIGFITVHLMPLEKIGSGWAAFFYPWLTSIFILIITILINVEGTICWIMIYPLFAIIAGIGGVIAYERKKSKFNKKDKFGIDNIGKPTQYSISLALFLPLCIGFIEGDNSLSKKEMTITEKIIVHATADKVWHAMAHIDSICTHKNSFSVLMGFPKHTGTFVDSFALGGKRLAVYERGLYFEETITRFEKNKLLVLAIHADPKKIPPTVMDEHILIGGKHVDIIEDIYTLKALPDSSTEVILSGRFMINTPFNWYSGIWANFLMSTILSDELELIQARVENKL